MEYACRDVSKALTSISSDLESRGLTVNCEKTVRVLYVAMVIHPRSSKTPVVTALPSINITCGRTTIPLVDSTHMLGDVIDSNLSWKEHVDHVCLKVNRKIGALRRSFRQLCPVARRLFYLSIIQPDFDFGSLAFIPNILMSQRKRLVVTRRRAVRAVARGYQKDVAPLLNELMIDQIEHRWAQHVAVTTFRCRHGTAPPDLRKKLKSVDHGRTTRGALLRWLLHCTVMQKWRRSPDTSVRGSRSFHAETKSKAACLHRHGAREKSGVLNINTSIFLPPPQWN